MNILNLFYTLGLVGLYTVFGGGYVFWLMLLSASLAVVPFQNSIFFFVTPILILLWLFIMGTHPYDSTFAWLCIAYVPFYYISFLSIIIEIIKGILGVD